MEIPRTVLHALDDRAFRRPDSPALWTRRHGVWLPTSWRRYRHAVLSCAEGLAQLGFGKGDVLGIVGFNREEWLVADLAAMLLGGAPAGIYTNSSPEQLAYIAHHAQAKVLLVENATYLATVLSVRDELPALRAVVVMDPPEQLPETDLPEGVLSFRALLERGEARDDESFRPRADALDPASLATLVYTSGTTGHPKGVMLSHRNLVWTAHQLSLSTAVQPKEVVLSYLPLSHIAEQLASIHIPLLLGVEVHFAESLEKLPENLKEVRPTAFFAVPRVWEKLSAKVESGIRAQPLAKREAIRAAMKVTAERNRKVLARERVPVPTALAYEAARRLILDPLKEKAGLDRARVLVTAAAPISAELLERFASLDVVIREIYGQSEVSGPTSVNTEDFTRLGTVGRPMSGVELRIAEDGELLVRGENVCMGYYRDPKATAELLEDGWLHTGDVGALDEDGFLKITGRKKELIVTSGGKKTAPSHIEGLLKSLEPLGNALVVGEGRNYLVALLPLDPEKVPAFARARGFPSDPKALATDARFLAELDRRISEEVNPRLARFEQIKKFRVLPDDFTVEGGELTPSLKVRRQVVESRYADRIAELYASPEPVQRTA